MDPFLSTTKQDYTPKTTRRPDPVGMGNEFKDPLAESYKHYLQLSSAPKSPEPPIEDADIFLKKQEKVRPKITKIYFQSPINNEVIEKTYTFYGKSQYQTDYCDLEKEKEYKEEQRRKNEFRLPNDLDVPLTSHKYCYRNPITINSRAMEKPKPIKLPNNLDPDERVRKILNITTLKSEYGGVIGTLGDMVMEEHLHGTIDHNI